MTIKLQDVVLKPVADFGISVEFGNIIDDEIHNNVLNFDHAIALADLAGVTEITPSYTSVLVEYDNLQTDYATLSKQLLEYIGDDARTVSSPKIWQIPVCYEGEFAPDLADLSNKLGISEEDIISQHLSGDYKVYMYGFAPGYAYMGGVPNAIQAPRKETPVMNVPAASLMIAGPQCLITTIAMPAGWWVIGRAAKTPLRADQEKPFLFDVGDKVEFVRVSQAEFQKHMTKEMQEHK